MYDKKNTSSSSPLGGGPAGKGPLHHRPEDQVQDRGGPQGQLHVGEVQPGRQLGLVRQRPAREQAARAQAHQHNAEIRGRRLRHVSIPFLAHRSSKRLTIYFCLLTRWRNSANGTRNP